MLHEYDSLRQLQMEWITIKKSTALSCYAYITDHPSVRHYQELEDGPKATIAGRSTGRIHSEHQRAGDDGADLLSV
jgi:hypothetical protein